MSDFVNEFWNWYVILIVLISIVACAIFLWVQSQARPVDGKTADTTGHVWDETLEEYNNPLPRWWMGLFYITVIFALVYVALYPALGNFPGVFKWTSTGEYRQEVERADEQQALDHRRAQPGAAGVREQGLAVEPRPYRPHITLLRKASSPANQDLATALAPPPAPLTLPVNEFALYESRSTPDGVRYLPLASW